MIDLTSLDSILAWLQANPMEAVGIIAAILGITAEGSVQVRRKGKVWHVELPLQLKAGSFLIWAITLPPGIILYSKGRMADPCIVAHEEDHIRQMREWGVTAYTLMHLLAAVLFFKRSRTNPLERRPYEVQEACRADSVGDSDPAAA